MWGEYIEQRKKQRKKEEEELQKLKERQVSCNRCSEKLQHDDFVTKHNFRRQEEKCKERNKKP